MKLDNMVLETDQGGQAQRGDPILNKPDGKISSVFLMMAVSKSIIIVQSAR